ncbi:hypothetical protein LguiA_026194 [Lonicera macranthoides]
MKLKCNNLPISHQPSLTTQLRFLSRSPPLSSKLAVKGKGAPSLLSLLCNLGLLSISLQRLNFHIPMVNPLLSSKNRTVVALNPDETVSIQIHHIRCQPPPHHSSPHHWYPSFSLIFFSPRLVLV